MISSKRFAISGVCCSAEETLLRKKLDALVGPDKYRFNSLSGELVVHGDVAETVVTEELRRGGFGVRSSREIHEEGSFWQRHREAMLIGASAVLAATGLVAEWTESAPLVSRTLFGMAIILGGVKVFWKALAAFRSRSLDMNVLMASAVLGALVIDRWAEGAAVVVLFALSLVLESYSIARTRRAVRALMEAAPSETTVIRNGEEITVPSREVGPNEITVIRPGERIALDGIVTEGYSTVIQAAITGESTPMHAVPGSQVYAGSLNERGSLRIRVTNVFEDTILSRIIHLVEEAQQKRAPVQTFVERFARVYTPAVFTLAFLIAVVPPLLLQLSFEEWFYRGLVLLVIACPCALVISTPVTIVSAITHAARRGVLIKGGLHLEMVSKLRSLAFDKTGTLTKGKPNVTDVVPLNSFSREKTLQFAAALEYHSEHHLATAILTEAEKLSIPYETIRVENFESIPGMGIQATIDGRRYYLGNHRFCEERGYCSPTVEQQLEVFAREGKTGVVLGIEHEPIALIALSDTARTEGRATIASLRQSGIEHLVLLSGDNEAAARSLATDVGLTEWAAAQLPEQKLEAVENLKRRYGVVGMVGDGVNDAPALAAASVGIAMGVSGTDAALESADVVLMSDDIAKIPLVVSLSRRAMAIVKQNIALALLTKGLFLALSISGNATLWMAVLADDGAALAVILNGLRLLAFRGD